MSSKNLRSTKEEEDSEDSFAPTIPAGTQKEAFVAACRGFKGHLEASLNEVPLNVVDDVGASLLHWACFKRKTDIVKLLLERGIDTSLRTSTDSQTALHWACAGGSVHVVHALWQAGIHNYADVDLRGYQALHVAVQNGHYNLVHYLCLKNVEVDARDNENVTPLHWAAIKGHLDIARYLRTCGADASKQDVRGSTALHWAVTMANYPLASYLANERSLQQLLRVKDAKGNTPKALAPKDKRIFGFMLSKAELPRRLSDSMFKTLWLLVPSSIYLLYFITQWLQFSFVASALVVGLALLLVVYVIRPTFKPTMDCDTLMIGIFYSSASLSVAYWTYYCFTYAAEKVGLLYAYFFVGYVLTMMAIHVYLVHSNPGILKVNRANDAKEFIDEIERGHDPAPVCSSCQTRKPVRCKHDSVTNQCVIRFDHYCVWIFNVVGNDNHLVFMILLFMCASAHFWSLTSFLPVFFSLLPTPWTWTDLWNLLGYDYMLTYVILFQMLNGFWETLLFIQQSNMILSNVTMNEIMNWQHYPHFWRGGNAQEFENPFDKGLKNNLKRFISQGRVRDLYHLYRLVTSTEV